MINGLRSVQRQPVHVSFSSKKSKSPMAPQLHDPSKLQFTSFDRDYLQRSWHWLHDPEIKGLMRAPGFTRNEQEQWFEGLKGRTDCRIWGVAYGGAPIGAVGLKHITPDSAEYWGYIGEKEYWNGGLGSAMLQFAFRQGRELGLHELWLTVGRNNPRAIRVYQKHGFVAADVGEHVLTMRCQLHQPDPICAEGWEVLRYNPSRKAEWNEFVRRGKNATFMFQRDYMEYHSHRFEDGSLMVFNGGHLQAVLPGNRSGDSLVSHAGLTYGGLVVNHAATLKDVLASFHALLQHLASTGIPRLLYKQIPGFYNTLPDEEINYALFLLQARLYRRDCAAVVAQQDRLRFQERRERQAKKAQRLGVRLVEESDFGRFWSEVLEPRLQSRYGVKPVHSVDEIRLLASRFPENIRQFSAYMGDMIVAGTTIYETPTVAHAQYIAVTAEGQKSGALDHLFRWLIEERYRDKRFFDMGICNEHEGRELNHGLMEWKEGFGGRTYAHDFYEIQTANFRELEPVLTGVMSRTSAVGTPAALGSSGPVES
jgi:RimJ/RimL family protein N-acetyltransferase